MSAAIEIYNKPNFDYREECFAILQVNAWELVLKALLSKNRRRIYYKKARGQPYRTLSVSDALTRCERLFPAAVAFKPAAENLRLLIGYRDSAVHFYNRPGFGALIYALAQTSIVNFRDLLNASFDRDITKEISVSLLPLSFAPPVDPVAFLRDKANSSKSDAVAEFSRTIRDLVVQLESEGEDTARLLTTFSVSLVSTKKISSADLVVGVTSPAAPGARSVLVTKPVDPNKSHPYRQVDIVGRKGGAAGLGLKIGSKNVGPHQFQALVRTYDAKAKPEYCWRDETGAVTRYSPAWVEFMKRLSERDLDTAVRSYSAVLRGGT